MNCQIHAFRKFDSGPWKTTGPAEKFHHNKLTSFCSAPSSLALEPRILLALCHSLLVTTQKLQEMSSAKPPSLTAAMLLLCSSASSHDFC